MKRNSVRLILVAMIGAVLLVAVKGAADSKGATPASCGKLLLDPGDAASIDRDNAALAQALHVLPDPPARWRFANASEAASYYAALVGEAQKCVSSANSQVARSSVRLLVLTKLTEDYGEVLAHYGRCNAAHSQERRALSLNKLSFSLVSPIGRNPSNYEFLRESSLHTADEIAKLDASIKRTCVPHA